MKPLLLLILSIATPTLLSAGSEIGGATVTLPYQELASLVDRVNTLERENDEQPVRPPVPIIVHTAHYTLNCQNPENSILQAKFEVSNLSGDWQSVPLIQAGRAIRSIEPNTAKIVESDGWLRLLIEPDTKASVELSLMTSKALQSRGGQTIAAFDAIPAVQSALSVQIGGDQSSIAVAGAVAANAGNTEFGLPSAGGSVSVKRYETSTVSSAKWNGSAQYLVSESQEALQIECRLRLTATDNGRTSEVELSLPVLANLVHIESKGMADKHSTEMSNNSQTVRLRWEDEDSSFRTIHLKYSIPINFASNLWQIDGVEASRTTQWAQAFYILPFDGIDLAPTDGDWMEAGRLPNWIADLAGNSDLHYIRRDSIADLELRARNLERMKTSVATVSMANYATQLVAEGGMLHQAVITVEHGASASYRFSLPDGAKLLSCSVNKISTYPLLLNDGGLELKLPQPHTGSSSTKLSYSYTTNGDKLNPVEGKANLALPLTPLFIHRLSWQVQLPTEYQATALEGNVVIEEGGSNGRPIRLGKQICHGEVPYAALYYTRRDLDH